MILSLLYPSRFSYLLWLDTACHLQHLTCFTVKRLTSQEISKGKSYSSLSDCHVLIFCRSLLPVFTVVSRTVCSWISMGFLSSVCAVFLFFILKTNSCKYISNVNIGSRWVYRMAISKLLVMFKFSIQTVSYMKCNHAWRS